MLTSGSKNNTRMNKPIPLLSIIVPVFNAEAWLEDCLESILRQSFQEIEVILVNDGSTDASDNICDRFASLDYRIKVLHKSKNGGLSEARNDGLKQATASYITFVDADDTVSEDIYTANMQILLTDKTIDLLEFPAFIHYCSPKQYVWRMPTGNIRGSENIIIHWMQNEGYLHCYFCNKIFKRELFNELAFPSGKVYEDTFLLPLILRRTQHVYYSPSGVYFYHYRLSSITKDYSAAKLTDLFDAYIILLEQTSTIPGIRKERMLLYLHAVDTAIDINRAIKREKCTLPTSISKLGAYRISLSELFGLPMSLRRKLKFIPLVLFGKNSQLYYIFASL